MSHRLPAVVLACALAVGGGSGCSDRGHDRSKPAATKTPGTPLLEVADLPDGYADSPPEPAPEVSTVSRVSIAGCDGLLDYFGDGGGGAADVRFEAGSAGPFVAEKIAGKAADKAADKIAGRSDGSDLPGLARRCASFTETDADGVTTAVTVQPVTDFPRIADDQAVFSMQAAGGTGDDAYRLSGYLLVLKVKAATCILVHFGQPAVDRAETETIAKAAVAKVRQE